MDYSNTEGVASSDVGVVCVTAKGNMSSSLAGAKEACGDPKCGDATVASLFEGDESVWGSVGHLSSDMACTVGYYIEETEGTSGPTE